MWYNESMDNTNHEGAGRGGKNINMMALFSYLWILIIIPFLTDAKKDPFVKYHLKQGLVLVIFEVVGMFIGIIPFIGWLVAWIMWLASFVLAIIGIMNVVNGHEKELPVIGQYAKSFHF
jgi:uncharacterized membrane protein